MKSVNYIMAAISFAAAAPAFAQGDERPKQTITIMAENQHYGKGRGDVNTASLEYKIDLGATAITLNPTAAVRGVPGPDIGTIGAGLGIWHDWTPSLSTRTSLAVAGNDGILPFLDVTQDVSVEVAKTVIATIGGRYARFQGRDVLFASAGARKYFSRGSVSYRLTHVEPARAKNFFAHLVNVSLNDEAGRGKTSLWLSYGGNADARTPIDPAFSGHDWGVTIQRVQPVSRRFALISRAGYESYDRIGGRIASPSVALGIQLLVP